VEISKGDVVNMDASAFIAELAVDVDGGMTVSNRNIAEFAMADFPTADTNADGVRVSAVQDAIRYVHVFARTWILKLRIASAQGQCVISYIDDAVADGNLMATININAVILANVWRVEDLNAADSDIFTAVEEARPASGILDGEVIQAHILAFTDEHQLLGPPSVATPGWPAHKCMNNRMILEDFGAASMKPAAPDEYILLLEGDDQMTAMAAACAAACLLLAKIFGVVVFRIEACLDDGTRIQFKTAVAFQPQGAANISAFRNIDGATCVNGTLNSLCVIRYAITNGTKITYILHWISS
jgi:hypothetical protein